MQYYEVFVGDMRFHGGGALTYHYDSMLAPGTVVRIALQQRSVLGIIYRSVPKPTFTTKALSAAFTAATIPPELLELIRWTNEYYPAPFGSIVRQFLPPTMVFPKTPSGEVSPPGPPQVRDDTPDLTRDQRTALDTIKPTGVHLVHGITGSGKTRLYVELVQRTLQAGRSSIVLTPEIGLTAQLTNSFETAFPGSVFVLHSRLTQAARRDIWYQVLTSTSPVIVVGARSALFSPVHNLGLIVMDESHDQAYKSDSAPKYRTERIAAKLAHLHEAALVMGSATPNVEDYYVAESKNLPIANLHMLATQQSETNVAIHTVDMRDRSNFTRSQIVSTKLIEQVQRALESHEQSLLFLNRRGTAAAILCSSCGWQALCPHCDLPLTYHADTHHMVCHVCGRKSSLPTSCPECQGADILFKTVGTKAVVSELERLFPSANIRRFDTDVPNADHIEKQFKELQNGKVDIIIGTQMVTKGLDLKNLAVVGILSADSSLLIPDFTANERTYQLITQVVGRIGRGHRDGTVVVQTYNPDHPTLRAALERQWETFYKQELSERKQFRFPPFVYMIKITCARASEASAEKAAKKLHTQLLDTKTGLLIEGPAPAFHPREDGKYKWQLVVKSKSRQQLVSIAKTLPSGWNFDIDPINLL